MATLLQIHNVWQDACQDHFVVLAPDQPTTFHTLDFPSSPQLRITNEKGNFVSPDSSQTTRLLLAESYGSPGLSIHGYIQDEIFFFGILSSSISTLKLAK